MTQACRMMVVLAALLSCLPIAAGAQTGPVIQEVPKECVAPEATVIAGSPLPNIALALKSRRKITILAMGASSASSRGPASGGHYAIVERFLESTFKGLDVVIVHRGVSGELAADAAERIKMEVALNSIDLVLWQVGTADALAHVPIDNLRGAVTQSIQWLKEHNVDVILVGLRYAISMVKDQHYQAVRATVRDIAKEQNVLMVGRYASEELMEKLRREKGVIPSEAEATEAGYVCLAEYLARAIAAGIFVRDDKGAGGKAPRQLN